MNNNHLIKYIGATLEILPEVDSTNNYAMQLIHDGTAEHGHAVLGLCQTNGKGQRGKHWHTGKNTNLALSVIISPTFLPLDKAFFLHTYVCHCIASHLNTLVNGFSVKWPNDIFYKNKKIGGILIENIIKGQQLHYSIMGIGINLNDENVDQIHRNAISLEQILGVKTDIIQFATGLLSVFNNNWKSFEENIDHFYKPYEKMLWKKDKVITIIHKEKPITTLCKTVNEQGQLICGENNELIFNFGEIEWVY